jgi:Flp pilus assembly protein TadD
VDVLSGLFWMLTLWAYSRYVEAKMASGPRPEEAGGTRKGILHYVLALMFFACALMSKPTVVTLPFVLLLLDYWPIQRFQLSSNGIFATWRRLLLEKAPLFVLSVVFSVAAFRAQQSSGNLPTESEIPFRFRLGNVLISYVRYIKKTIWPGDLAIYYPHPGVWPSWQVIGAGIFLVAISMVVVFQVRRRPFLLVGWLWYLGCLVPVIGLVQVGTYSMADRYAYLPLIGLFIAVGWGACELWPGWRWRKQALASVGAAALAGYGAVTWLQVGYWKTSESIFRHAIAVSSNSFVTQHNVATALANEGKFEEATIHFREALRMNPDYIPTHNNLGFVLAKQGKMEEATIHLSAVLKLEPHEASDYGRLGDALGMLGRTEEAVTQYLEALRLAPDSTVSLNNLAWIRATSSKENFRNGPEAVKLASRAAELQTYPDAEAMDVQAAAYAEAGNFSAAVSTEEKALALARSLGRRYLADQIEMRLRLYQAGRPYREP